MKKAGVLLLNLGSPDSPGVSDVRRYLREFLMDGRVLDTPYPVRWFVVHALILPTRPRQSAGAYQKIWTPEGSPLVVTSRKVQRALQLRLSLPVELAMRYQNPSIEAAVESLRRQGVTELLLIPLFPQHARSSFETAVERVKEVLRQRAPQVSLTVQPPCFDRPDYLEALVSSAAEYLGRPYDHLLFSFHGLPERHMRTADPTRTHCLQSAGCCRTPSPAHATCYRAQCFQTMDAFVQRAGVTRYSVAFQSRLGREPWLAPYTDQELPRLARAGIRKLLVICPAFVADCLETLEEIGLRGRDSFRDAGGEEFHLIPCLNEHPLWVRTLENMGRSFLAALAMPGEQASRTEG